jgi:hypothetical protein
MTVSPVLDAAGRRRSPATMPGYHAGRPPRNKGRLYPADPPTVEEIVAVMREASDDRHGYRLRAMIVVLWRGGLRVAEALALGERDLDPRRGSLLVRNGKGGRRREIGMDAWGWEQLRPWLAARLELPVGPLFCVIDGPTRGRPWSSAGSAASSAGSPPRPVSGAASRRTSCGTPTPWSSSETVPGLGARRRRPASASSETDAARAGMREFAARANVYRSRLGDESALTAARLLAAEIDNPALANDARRATCVPSRALRRRRVRRAFIAPSAYHALRPTLSAAGPASNPP